MRDFIPKQQHFWSAVWTLDVWTSCGGGFGKCKHLSVKCEDSVPLPVCSGVSVVHYVDLPDVFPVHGSLVRLILVNHLNDNRQSGAKQVHKVRSYTYIRK